MSDFWKRKIRRYFFVFDYDGDGLLSKSDFSGQAINFCSFGKPDKQKAEQLKTDFESAWDLYLKYAEVGNRNTLTPDDLIHSIAKQRYDPELMKPITGVIRGLHDMLDVNRDGYLQEDEYERILFQMGVPDPSFAKEGFRAIDVNKDGKLSVDEFINAFFEFLFSEDEKSPNTFFFGPVED